MQVTITDIAQGTDSIGIAEGLVQGIFTRYGGVIRHAKGTPLGGQIVAHLDDMGGAADRLLRQAPSDLPDAESLGQLMNLTSLTAVTNVVSLGVSVAGFAYTAHQLKQIQKGIDNLLHVTSQGFEAIQQHLDAIDRRLEEIALLGRANLLLGDEIREGISDVRSLLQSTVEAKLVASLETLSDVEAPNLEAHLTTLKDVRATCDAFMHRLTPTLDSSTASLSAAWSSRIWAAAASAEVDVLVRMGLQDIAARAGDDAVATSSELAASWITSSLDEEWTVLGHRRAEQHGIPLDRAWRVAEAVEGDELTRAEVRQVYAGATRWADATLGDQRFWDTRNAVGALADGLVESGRRTWSHARTTEEAVGVDTR